MLESKLPPCPAPHTFTARCPEHFHETSIWEEQEMVPVQPDSVQQSAVPDAFLGPMLATSAFHVFLYYMPDNNDGHAYNELVS